MTRAAIHRWARAAGMILFVVWLAALPARAQDDAGGAGVVRLSVLPGDSDFSSLLPHRCSNPSCRSLQALIYPSVFDVDPVSGALLDASTSDRALALSLPPEQPADEWVIDVRRDRAWSDGQPITAYDVLYSLFRLYPIELIELADIRLVDEYTLRFRYAAETPLSPSTYISSPTCEDVAYTNPIVVPSHQYEPGFRAFIDEYDSGDTHVGLEWQAAYLQALGADVSLPPDPAGLVTAGDYRFVETGADGVPRLIAVEPGAPAIELIGVAQTTRDPFRRWLAGEADAIIDIPRDEQAAFHAADQDDPRVRIVETPGYEQVVINFNFADPRRPLPAFHPVTGEALDQGVHPILGDVQVRRALRMAIDYDAIITNGYGGGARRLAGMFPPASWAHDETLPLTAYNPREAERLLYDAGWFDNDGDGIRNCVRCGTAAVGTVLSLELAVTSDRLDPIAAQILRDWRRLGVGVSTRVDNAYLTVHNQTFDAELVGFEGMISAPDCALPCLPEGDVLGTSLLAQNYMSYNNPEAALLIEAARTVPGCGIPERRAHYAELERVLYDDAAFIPIASPNEFHAASRNVIGFDPRPGDPLWNIESWRVIR